MPVDNNVNLEETAFGTRDPNALVGPLSSMTLNEKPTPKPRPNRKRVGFYTSLCSDIADFERGEEREVGGKAKHGSRVKKESTKPKKEKRLRGSKYYASLADDIVAMKLQQEESEMKRHTPSRENDTAERELTKTRNVKREEVQLDEIDVSEASLSDEEPPKWFHKVVTKVS